MMRVGIVGNCQSAVMARWLEVMLPSDTIVHHSIAQPPETFDAAADELRTCDVLISQWIGPGHGRLETEHLRNAVPRFLIVPNFSFTGFHPDITYLTSNGSVVASPIGAYHSRIVAAAYRLGLSADQTEFLFNRYIYQILGYLDEFDKAEAHFEEIATGQGFWIRVRDLMKDGAFMYTINHCNVDAARVLTYQAAKLVGLSPEEDVPQIADPLSDDTIWPVYPQIADRIGMPGGSLTFIPPRHFAVDRERAVSLRELIVESFRIYEAQRDIIDFGAVQGEMDKIASVLESSYA